MKRTSKLTRVLLAALAVVVTTTSVSAGWNDFWHNLHVGYYRNNAWPDPFNEVDAATVMAPFEIMKHNGWKMHNTIGHELFREGDGALLASGHNRIRWIATQAPEARRGVFVLRGRTNEETDARVEAVRETLTNLNLQGPAPEVMITNIEPATSPGEWATKVNRDRLEYLSKPRLPSSSASGTQGVATP